MQKIRKGDKVVVLTGKDKGRTGEVIQVMPKEDRAVVRGVNMVKRHQRQTQSQEAQPSFIEVAMATQRPLLRGGQRQWGAAGAGGKAEIAQTEAPQLLDQQTGPTQAQVVARMHHGCGAGAAARRRAR